MEGSEHGKEAALKPVVKERATRRRCVAKSLVKGEEHAGASGLCGEGAVLHVRVDGRAA
jgi:hypothetical protein